MLRILQINLHHCKAASVALLLRLTTGAVDLVFIQEPWVRGGRVCGLKTPGFKLMVATGGGSPRACILARNSLNIFFLSSFSDMDVTAASLELNGRSIWLASAYFPNPGQIPPEKVSGLIREAESRGHQLVVCCDANAHHPIWGSTDTNERGETLLEFLLSTNLYICNRGSEPTFVTSRRQEVLDLTLVSDSLSDRIDDWKVLEEHSFSDHRYLEFSLRERGPVEVVSRNLKRTNWVKYRETFSGLLDKKPLSEPHSLAEIDCLVDHITNVCNRSLDAACPSAKPRGKKKPPWWSNELQSSRDSCRKLFNKAKSSRADEDWSAYRLQLKSYKKMIRNAKCDSWKNFCGNIEDVSEASRLRKVLASSPCTLGYLKDSDGVWSTSSGESLELLLNTHFPGNSMTPFQALERSDAQASEIASEIINMPTLIWAIKSFRPYKSPGPDGIIPAEMQQVSDYIAPWLYNLYTACINWSYIPLKWRDTRVVFIPKAGKNSHTVPKDFRPISLSSFLLKTMERMIDSYLRRVIDPRLLSTRQHAYSKGRSTETALHELVGTIERSLSVKEYTMVAFLDIEGAFNNVIPDSIIEALSSLGVKHGIVLMVENLLANRRITSELGTSTISRFVNRGTPQGGVLSPLLWNLALNSMLLSLEASGCHVVAYADDVAIAVKGKHLPTIKDILQGSLTDLSKWARNCGLGVNPNKTELVLFTRKNKIPAFDPISLDGTEIAFSDGAKYLGVFLDRKLNFRRNIEERVRKATIALYSCKRAIGKRWGFSPKVVHWIYTAVVRPILLYGIIVWWPALETKVNCVLITKVQRMASMCITGALRTTPTAALEILLYLIPLDILGRQYAATSAIRLNSTLQWKSSDCGHSAILKKITIPQNVDCAPSMSLFERHFTTMIPSRESWMMGIPGGEASINFYTDGSKLHEQVGFGVYSEELGLSLARRLPDHCSVYQAEMLAIKEVADWLSCNVLSTTAVNIYSDSQAAVKSLKSMFLKTRSALNCRTSLNEMAKQFDIRLIWVPGHRDIPGNCKADELARLGTTLQVPTELECVGMPLETCKLNLRICSATETNQRWAHGWTCETTRQIWPSLDQGRTSGLISLSRGEISTVVAVITGHCLIGKHAERLNVPSNDFCRSCMDEEELETIEHFVCHCPALSGQRHASLGSKELHDLSDLSDVKIQHLRSFIRSSNWFNDGD